MSSSMLLRHQREPQKEQQLHEWKTQPVPNQETGFSSNHEVFLSHSGQQKSFVEQLRRELERANFRPFFDRGPDHSRKSESFAPDLFAAVEQCRVAVVILSEDYLSSKWPMLELSMFVQSMKSTKPGPKLLPLFYKVSPNDITPNEVETKWKEIWRQLVERGEVREEVLSLWSESVEELRSICGLDYRRFANSESKFRSAVVDEICNWEIMRSKLKAKVGFVENTLIPMELRLTNQDLICFGELTQLHSTWAKEIMEWEINKHNKFKDQPKVFLSLGVWDEQCASLINMLKKFWQKNFARTPIGEITSLNVLATFKKELITSSSRLSDEEDSYDSIILYVNYPLPSIQNGLNFEGSCIEVGLSRFNKTKALVRSNGVKTCSLEHLQEPYSQLHFLLLAMLEGYFRCTLPSLLQLQPDLVEIFKAFIKFVQKQAQKIACEANNNDHRGGSSNLSPILNEDAKISMALSMLNCLSAYHCNVWDVFDIAIQAKGSIGFEMAKDLIGLSKVVINHFVSLEEIEEDDCISTSKQTSDDEALDAILANAENLALNEAINGPWAIEECLLPLQEVIRNGMLKRIDHLGSMLNQVDGTKCLMGVEDGEMLMNGIGGSKCLIGVEDGGMLMNEIGGTKCLIGVEDGEMLMNGIGGSKCLIGVEDGGMLMNEIGGTKCLIGVEDGEMLMNGIGGTKCLIGVEDGEMLMNGIGGTKCLIGVEDGGMLMNEAGGTKCLLEVEDGGMLMNKVDCTKCLKRYDSSILGGDCGMLPINVDGIGPLKGQDSLVSIEGGGLLFNKVDDIGCLEVHKLLAPLQVECGMLLNRVGGIGPLKGQESIVPIEDGGMLDKIDDIVHLEGHGSLSSAVFGGMLSNKVDGVGQSRGVVALEPMEDGGMLLNEVDGVQLLKGCDSLASLEDCVMLLNKVDGIGPLKGHNSLTIAQDGTMLLNSDGIKRLDGCGFPTIEEDGGIFKDIGRLNGCGCLPIAEDGGWFPNIDKVGSLKGCDCLATMEGGNMLKEHCDFASLKYSNDNLVCMGLNGLSHLEETNCNVMLKKTNGGTEGLATCIPAIEETKGFIMCEENLKENYGPVPMECTIPLSDGTNQLASLMKTNGFGMEKATHSGAIQENVISRDQMNQSSEKSRSFESGNETDNSDNEGSSGGSLVRHHGSQVHITRDNACCRTTTKYSGKKRLYEDDIITQLVPLIKQQVEEALLPLVSVLQSREVEEQKHREQLLALEEQKLALKREKLLFKRSRAALSQPTNPRASGNSTHRFGFSEHHGSKH